MTAPSMGPRGTQATGTSRSKRNVFWRFAARSLKLNRTRTVVSIIGIALSCALITAIFTSVASLYQGLLTAEIKNDGTWQVELINIDDEGLQRLDRDSRIEKTYLRDIYGSALMPESFEGYWGRYLDVHAWPTEQSVHGLKPLPHLVEGRAPKKPGEIVLPRTLKGTTVADGQFLYDTLENTGKDADVERAAWDGKLELGTGIRLALGQRIYLDPDSGYEVPCLYNESLYTNEGAHGDVVSEYLAETTPADAYIVVGFYGPESERSVDVWGGNGSGYVGFIAGGALEPREVSAYLTTNLKSRNEIDRLLSDYSSGNIDTFFSSEHVRTARDASDPGTAGVLHDALLRYQGMTDDRAIWDTLYTLAGILSCVVIAASVSLIYNSFAIAVSERTRQFGLLSSLGASKRQLRRTVYAEALMLAAIGIPAGLLLGIGGTTVVFSVAGEGIGMLIDQEAFAGTGVSAIRVEPAILALSAVLALITVLISAAVPAWRASRVSAVDAIRQARDVKPGRSERLAKMRAAAGKTSALGRALDNMRLRVSGVPGLLAHRNLTRSSSKGRVAVASLAVSVALIIISGAIAHYMGKLTEVSSSTGGDIEVTMSRILKEGETTADGLASIEAIYEKLGKVEGAGQDGLAILSALNGKFDPGVIDYADLSKTGNETMSVPDVIGKTDDGSVLSSLTMLFVDRAVWDELLAQNDIDSALLGTADAPRAVALNNVRYTTANKYAFSRAFANIGSVQLLTEIDCADTDYLTGCQVDEHGVPIACYEGYGDTVAVPEQGTATISSAPDDAAYDDQRFHTYTKPLDEVLRNSYDLEIGAIADKLPEQIGYFATSLPTLVLPFDALPALAKDSEGLISNGMNGSLTAPFAFHSTEGARGNSIDATLSFTATDARAAEKAMNEIRDADLNGSEWHRSYLINNAEHARTGRVMYETVQLFINCFIVITSTIAVANVFNTLTNSIILRRREFAMLKSIGMGKRTFWRMIALECLSYAWRGLAIGLVLGAVVTFLIYQSMQISFAGLTFVVPFGWVIAAVGVVIGVLAISTAYALRKSTSGSIVQTLREDAI